MNEGVASSIFYFRNEGRTNLESTLCKALERAVEKDIAKIVVFTADGEGIFSLHKMLMDKNVNNMKIIGVTFPQNRPFYTEEKDGKMEKFFPKTSDSEIKEAIRKIGIPLVQGVMPFEEVIVPGAKQSNMRIIKETLGLFSGGMQLCVQAALMATDAGCVDIGESVIAVAADTAIVVKGALSEYLFHPHEGLNILEIICKPSKMTV